MYQVFICNKVFPSENSKINVSEISLPKGGGAIKGIGDTLSPQVVGVKLGSANLNVCSVAVENFTSDTVAVKYSGLPGNQPETYANYVAIWESTVIPWGVNPIKEVKIPNNAMSGTVVISGLTITMSTYIIGYSIGAEFSDIACSALLSAGGLRGAPTNVSIGLDFVGSDSLSINYQTLLGYKPATYGNWIGLWKGYYSPYVPSTPVGKVKITSDSTQGSVGMNNVPLGINSDYTLVYFLGESETKATAILYFNTSDGSDQKKNNTTSNLLT